MKLKSDKSPEVLHHQHLLSVNLKPQLGEDQPDQLGQHLIGFGRGRTVKEVLVIVKVREVELFPDVRQNSCCC